MLPSDKCHVILSHTITYVLMLKFALLSFFLVNIICLLNLLKCLLLFLGLIFDAATKKTK